jgi:hypothetical protein
LFTHPDTFHQDLGHEATQRSGGVGLGGNSANSYPKEEEYDAVAQAERSHRHGKIRIDIALEAILHQRKIT